MQQIDLDLNRPGNVVHTTILEKLGDISRYGLVSQYHNRLSEPGHDKFDIGYCPCGQTIEQQIIDRLNFRGLLFFHAIGASFSMGKTSITNLWAPIVEGNFGILIQPEDFLKGNPRKEDYELKAFTGDKEALKQRGVRRYWEQVSMEAVWQGSGRSHESHDWEYIIPSCVPWQKFTAIVAPKHERTAREIIAHIESLPRKLQIPVYDTSNALLFAPN